MFSRILSFFYSHPCSHCGHLDFLSNRFGVCIHCIRKRRKFQRDHFDPSVCSVCSHKREEGKDCAFCSSRFVFFSRLEFLHYRFPWEKETFQMCKFQKERLLSFYFALDFRRKKISKRQIERPDAIVFLPSGDLKLGRGYHPAEILGKRLALKWKIPILPGVRKASHEKQSGKMYRERFFHAKKAFLFRKNDRMCNGIHILIIDDIFTTGASLNEVARLYLENGASRVSCMVLLINEGD